MADGAEMHARLVESKELVQCRNLFEGAEQRVILSLLDAAIPMWEPPREKTREEALAEARSMEDVENLVWRIASLTYDYIAMVDDRTLPEETRRASANVALNRLRTMTEKWHEAVERD